VKLTVPGLDGLYSGEITITNLNSRPTVPLSWPIELNLNLVPAGVSQLYLRGSPYFGHVGSTIDLANVSLGSDFDLQATLVLNVGNSNNPFSTSIQRNVRFHGGRMAVGGGLAAGSNLGLFGDYQEQISGPPSVDIQLSGFFSITAKTDKQALEEK